MHPLSPTPDSRRPFEVRWEQIPWDRDPDRSLPRRQREAARGPYQAVVPASIRGAVVHASSAVLAEAEDAIREITRFDAEAASMTAWRTPEARRPLAGEITPLDSVLLRTESASSSQIEGVTVRAKALALAAISESTARNAQLVTANVVAMRKAIELADAISVETILGVHAALLQGHAGAAPGRFREVQGWIGSNASTPHTASFVPPHHGRIAQGMDDLMGFVHRTELPLLPQVAIAHAQFETIHPFNDGNGRVGRTLVHAMLRHAGVTRRLTVPLSAGLLASTADYFNALGSYRDGDIEPIITQFAAASFRAVDNGRRLIGDLDAVCRNWSGRLASRHGSAARRFLPHLVNQPAILISHVQQVLGVALSAAQRAVEQLAEAGILEQAGAGRRNRIWIAPEVVAALDAFAARAGRRS